MEGSDRGVQVPADHHQRFLCAAEVLLEPAPPLRAGLLLPDKGPLDSSCRCLFSIFLRNFDYLDRDLEICHSFVANQSTSLQARAQRGGLRLHHADAQISKKALG